eukprot:4312217-Pyramimonas_sp.AAC.1
MASLTSVDRTTLGVLVGFWNNNARDVASDLPEKQRHRSASLVLEREPKPCRRNSQSKHYPRQC